MSQNSPLSYAAGALRQGAGSGGGSGGGHGLLNDEEPLVFGLTRSAWLKVGVIAGLMAAIFWPNLRRLWEKTNPFTGEPNWQHSIVVPLIGLYYLFLNREQLLKAPVRSARLDADEHPHFRWNFAFREFYRLGFWLWLGAMVVVALAWWQGALGSPVLAGAAFAGVTVFFAHFLFARVLTSGQLGMLILLEGLLLYAYGIWPGQNDYFKDLGMVVTLFGVVLALAGWAVMRIAWFPIVFLVAALPWPGLVYSLVAGPLQKLAAEVAVQALQFTGVIADRQGTKIMMESSGGWRVLNVAEACAGMRSLMTFIAVGAAIAFLSARPLWQKLVITASAIPIAIFCNVMRVAGQGLLDYYWTQEISEGFAHTFTGMIMLIPGFFLLLLVGWFLDHLFVDEVDEKQRQAARARAAALRTPPTTAGGQVALAGAGAPVAAATAAPVVQRPAVQRPAQRPAAQQQPATQQPAARPAAVTPPPPARATPPRPGTGATPGVVRVPPRPTGIAGGVRPAAPRKPAGPQGPTQQGPGAGPAGQAGPKPPAPRPPQQ